MVEAVLAGFMDESVGRDAVCHKNRDRPASCDRKSHRGFCQPLLETRAERVKPVSSWIRK